MRQKFTPSFTVWGGDPFSQKLQEAVWDSQQVNEMEPAN